jgi:signal transduction histidine kinase
MVPVLIIGVGIGVLGAAGASRNAAAAAALRSSGRADGLGRLALVTGPYGWLRIVVGMGILAWGLGALGFGNGALVGLRTALLGLVLAVAGIALAFGPQIARLAQQLGDERRERIRSEERAAMAAHLHDSVLQTLALIQRTAQDPRRTVTLARRQERELRAWLYPPSVVARPVEDGHGVAVAVGELVEEVEELHDVQVDVVVVGDAPVDERVEALLAATREATVNAAKHAGVDEISLFVEVDDEGVSSFVRDRGRGFDLAAVPPDRHGLSRSIGQRLHRVGGSVEVDTAPGAGTEVRLHLPVHRVARDAPWEGVAVVEAASSAAPPPGGGGSGP